MIRTLVLYDESDLDEALEYLTESIEHERRSAQRETAGEIRQPPTALDRRG